MKRTKTPTFLIELPLRLDWSQERHIRAHLEVARCLYNALLSQAKTRLHQMRSDPEWSKARALARTRKQERGQTFTALRRKHHFSEDDLHTYAKQAHVLWIADHIDSTMAQTLATRAYQAVNRVAVGKAKRVRFRSRGRGIDSVEGKRNDVGLRFVLDPGVGDGGFLIWNEQVIPALIDWLDPVVQHGLRHPIKYVRLIRRKASSSQAKGADHDGNRYFVQLILEGHAFTKPKHERLGCDIIGLDIGPSTLAIVPRKGKADLIAFCEELSPDTRWSDRATSRDRWGRQWPVRPSLARTVQPRSPRPTTVGCCHLGTFWRLVPICPAALRSANPPHVPRLARCLPLLRDGTTHATA